MTLLRRQLGAVLRRHREAQQRTLRDVAGRAGVSLGYLSEVERGVKEASSELLAAICGALALSLPDLLVEVAGELYQAMPPVLVGVPEDVAVARRLPAGDARAAA
jgi:transcriptional regulator with XRE-family HTH domain